MAFAGEHIFSDCSAQRQTRRHKGPFSSFTRDRHATEKRGFRKKRYSCKCRQSLENKPLPTHGWITDLGPFGEVIRASGPMAKTNPVRFSTKYQDDESDLLYYGYRYYNAKNGKWGRRDLIYENGGLNLYAPAQNDFINYADFLGLSTPECINLLADMARKSALFAAELAKYDPVSDGKGGSPMAYGSGLTKPGGHYNEMMDLKKGIFRDLMNYYKKCVCKDCGDPPPPKKYEDVVNYYVPQPIYPMQWLNNVPGGDGFWMGAATASGYVAIGAATTAGIIVAPEITLPALPQIFKATCNAH